MSTSQLGKLREGQQEMAVGIHIRIRLHLGNFSLPIVTIKPVLSLKFDLIQAVNECMWWDKGSIGVWRSAV